MKLQEEVQYTLSGLKPSHIIAAFLAAAAFILLSFAAFSNFEPLLGLAALVAGLMCLMNGALMLDRRDNAEESAEKLFSTLRNPEARLTYVRTDGEVTGVLTVPERSITTEMLINGTTKVVIDRTSEINIVIAADTLEVLQRHGVVLPEVPAENEVPSDK